MNSKTIRKVREHTKGTRRFQLHNQAKATMGLGNASLAVRLPDGEDKNEWLAVNTVDFYNQVNVLYGTVSEYCTASSCPKMAAGDKFEYLWAATPKDKPVQCSAPEYVGHLMTWVESVLDDPKVFPVTTDQKFPKDFEKHIQTIFKRLFRVYAHIYYNHFAECIKWTPNNEAFLNTCFKHFYYFINEFSLVEKKELAPLEDLFKRLALHDEAQEKASKEKEKEKDKDKEKEKEKDKKKKK